MPPERHPLDDEDCSANGAVRLECSTRSGSAAFRKSILEFQPARINPCRTISPQEPKAFQSLRQRTSAAHGWNGLVHEFLWRGDFSIPTLRGLKRAIVEGKAPEPFHPEGCDFAVFREILGTDPAMTKAIWLTLSQRYAPEQLKDIPGMTEDLMAKLRAAFLEPDKSGNQS